MHHWNCGLTRRGQCMGEIVVLVVTIDEVGVERRGEVRS